MRTLTLVVGGVLTAMGVVAYLVTGMSSWTALIPSIVGVLLLVCGLVGRQGSARKHAMHAGAAIALLGLLGSLMNTVKIGQVFAGTAERPSAVVVSALMFLALLVYLVAVVRSFVQARRARTAVPA